MTRRKEDMKAKEQTDEITHNKQDLKCTLTEAELLKAAREMADAQNRAAELEAEIKNYQTQAKSRLASEESLVAAKASVIRCGYEFRQVECDVIWCYETGLVTNVRTDTGETIETRAMSESERQLKINL